MKTQNGLRLGKQAALISKSTCPTSHKTTMRQERVTGNVSRRQRRWWLRFYGKIDSDDEYNRIRSQFGDTTSVMAQIQALESLGLSAQFRKDGDSDFD